MLGDLCAVCPPDWSIRSVEEVCSRVTSGGTPSRREPAYYMGGRWPWVKTQELLDCWIDDTEEHITDAAVAASSAKILPEHTILLALYGATVGQLGLLRRAMTCNQACCAMLVNKKIASYRYLYYQLLLHRGQLKGLATGAAQQNLSGALMRSFRLPFPPLNEQHVIASFLGSLDDKIELNRRMNRTLEQMAAAIFKAWFVDFEPVRAKASGAASFPGMPQAVFDALPAALADSELGPLPKGWRVGKVHDLGNIICGKTPSTADPRNYGRYMPFITIPDMHGRAVVTSTRKYLSEKGVATQAGKTLPPGAICVSCIATPGLTVLTSQPCQTNQQINSIVPHKDYGSYFTYGVLRMLGWQIAQTGSGGSVFANLSKGRFSSLAVVIAPPPIAAQYNEMVNPYFSLLAGR